MSIEKLIKKESQKIRPGTWDLVDGALEPNDIEAKAYRESIGDIALIGTFCIFDKEKEDVKSSR